MINYKIASQVDGLNGRERQEKLKEIINLPNSLRAELRDKVRENKDLFHKAFGFRLSDRIYLQKVSIYFYMEKRAREVVKISDLRKRFGVLL